jgi:hypothetical protein
MYSVTVKIDGIENRRRSAGLLHVVIGLFLIAKGIQYYQATEYRDFIPVIPVLLVAALSIFYGFFRRRVDPFAHYNYGVRLIQIVCFTALGVMMVNKARPVDYFGVFVFVVLCMVLLFSERRIFHETTIFLDENGIRIPGYYRDHLVHWEELTDVTIREDFITLFHVKQKYLQYQVMQDLSTLETAKMNAFCREKLEAVNVKRET